MKIVKFKNGKYGIRRFSWIYLCYLYKELGTNMWWRRVAYLIRKCQGTYEQVKEDYERHTDKGTPV